MEYGLVLLYELTHRQALQKVSKTSCWSAKDGKHRKALWSVHIVVQACSGQRKENGCKRKNGNGVWGKKKKKAVETLPVINNPYPLWKSYWKDGPNFYSPDASSQIWVLPSQPDRVCPATHPAPAQIPSLCCPRRPHTAPKAEPILSFYGSPKNPSPGAPGLVLQLLSQRLCRGGILLKDKEEDGPGGYFEASLRQVVSISGFAVDFWHVFLVSLWFLWHPYRLADGALVGVFTFCGFVFGKLIPPLTHTTCKYLDEEKQVSNSGLYIPLGPCANTPLWTKCQLSWWRLAPCTWQQWRSLLPLISSYSLIYGPTIFQPTLQYLHGVDSENLQPLVINIYGIFARPQRSFL